MVTGKSPAETSAAYVAFSSYQEIRNQNLQLLIRIQGKGVARDCFKICTTFHSSSGVGGGGVGVERAPKISRCLCLLVAFIESLCNCQT